MRENFKAALVGLAVGDALGATTEFMSKEEIKEQYGYLNEMIGGGWLNIEAGDITDDTEMTLCVAKGIIKNHLEPIPAIGEMFLEWYKTKPKDIGFIILNTIRNYKGDWFKAAKLSHKIVGKSAGNGSLMRCLPIALAYKDKYIIKDLSIKQSKMTHFDDLASEACLIYNMIAYQVINGKDLKEAIEMETKNTRYFKVLKENLDLLPDGYVVNTFSWVLNVLYTTNSFSEVVETLANLGEDADTTAAIAGGLAGLHYGYDAIENKYKDKIIIREELEKIANKLYNLRENN